MSENRKVNINLQHSSVLLSETVEAVSAHLHKQALIVDATLGAGGHTKKLLLKGAKVIAFEADPEVFESTKKTIDDLMKVNSLDGSQFKVFNKNFVDMDLVFADEKIDKVDGFVFDLGIGRMHYFEENRGFSFANLNQPLDMRLNPNIQGVKANDILNALPQKELKKMFLEVLDYKIASKIASMIVERRIEKPFEKVSDLIEIIIKSGLVSKKINPATKIFLILRIKVNMEIEAIISGLKKAIKYLKKGGRIAVITFHSLEEREVKTFAKSVESLNIGKLVSKKPVEPTMTEKSMNKSSRSARLWIIEKI